MKKIVLSTVVAISAMAILSGCESAGDIMFSPVMGSLLDAVNQIVLP